VVRGIHFDAAKCPPAADGRPGHIRVAYETRQTIEWGGERADRAGRTFEEAFVLWNLEWCMKEAQADLGFRLPGAEAATVDGLHAQIHESVLKVDKTRFALALIGKDPEEWSAPPYIIEGLEWLRDQLMVDAAQATPLAAIDVEVAE